MQKRLAGSPQVPQLGLNSEAPGANAGNASMDEILKDIRAEAQEKLKAKFQSHEISDRSSENTRKRVRKEIIEIIESKTTLSKPEQLYLAEKLIDDLLGYGPLEVFFNPPLSDQVTEIKVNRWDHIRIEKNGIDMPAVDDKGNPLRFRDENHARDVLDRMLAPTGRKVDGSTPCVSARLPDGSRLMAQIPPVAVDGTIITIRRFKTDMSMEKLLEYGALNEEIKDFLSRAVYSRLNIFISGATGSGKSATLSCLTMYIPENESIITIEDPAELQLKHPNVRRLEAKPKNIEGEGEVTTWELVAQALRMAPKRIIVGECRNNEALDMVQAMGTGHDGSMSTGHANSADHMLNNRLVNLIQGTGRELPYETIIRMLADSIDIVVHQQQQRDGRRRIDHIAEVVGYEKVAGKYKVKLNNIFEYSKEKDTWLRTEHIFTRQERLVL
ncbi:type II/IV secretion system ATP hydrolase [Desulfocucumis palustris]|uniref:Type II/IV secretion system ATP hydrolase n=1 Tax=Desulfocucumis palustris TaxID=1898651 RepID=A0A2L2XCA9_9FIRM|nr:type II/IV secretion system ATP hydrolase [Desulfocucumis palustris]